MSGICAMITALALASAAGAADSKIRVLLLSGSNNHTWAETTPVIQTVLEQSGRFAVDVTEDVPHLKPDAFDAYDLILSNYNDFGQKPAISLSDETKKAFIAHLAKGHGLLIIHAGSSTFYDWPEFQALACGSWQEKTSHGPIHISQVTFTSNSSPITEGLKPFWIRDEFWQDTQTVQGAVSLACVTPDAKAGGSGKSENILFTNQIGKARGCGLFLGHDTTSMKNTAWRTLLQRCAEWAATGKVTLPPAADWPNTPADAERMTK